MWKPDTPDDRLTASAPREEYQAETERHLTAAATVLNGMSDASLDDYRHHLAAAELSAAFAALVEAGHERELPMVFWKHLDAAAQRLGLYAAALHEPRLTAADVCRRHLAPSGASHA
ncbi:hypothetical protein [Stackebrandtia soli]|uniref:hypothetical protein n=1 Tax=Stackebrandtia soli TaxID=1892856 RepID=UPI0039EB1189